LTDLVVAKATSRTPRQIDGIGTTDADRLGRSMSTRRTTSYDGGSSRASAAALGLPGSAV
jgi:hypothetical protein